jgi:23S rRNA (cytidine1920-2'-O)/16S rRNA (cytidine1409-2'-O)-methyltransferase
MRLDAALVARGLCSSRTGAQKAIQQGRVEIIKLPDPDRRTIEKPSFEVSDSDQIFLTVNEADRFVSRGALKLIGALQETGLSPLDLTCLDVGQSTGGFTDVLLQQGATRVLGLEVGSDQLHPSLRTHAKTLCIEGVNARDCVKADLFEQIAKTGKLVENWFPATGFDLVVMDVSFISLLKVSANLRQFMSPQGQGLWLVKPQFEVGKSMIGKGGLVKPEALGADFEKTIVSGLQSQHYVVKRFFSSPITGGDGNQEFFVWVCPA